MRVDVPVWVSYVVSVVLALMGPVFWCGLLVWSVRREPRRLRNGLFLIVAVVSVVALVGQGRAHV